MARSRNSKHHRRPSSTGGSDVRENISWVTEKKHRAWHMLFADVEPPAIAKIINDEWLDPAWDLVACKKRKRRKKKK